MLTFQEVEQMDGAIYEAVLSALEKVGLAQIKSGPFFGVGEFRGRDELKAA